MIMAPRKTVKQEKSWLKRRKARDITSLLKTPLDEGLRENKGIYHETAYCLLKHVLKDKKDIVFMPFEALGYDADTASFFFDPEEFAQPLNKESKIIMLVPQPDHIWGVVVDVVERRVEYFDLMPVNQYRETVTTLLLDSLKSSFGDPFSFSPYFPEGFNFGEGWFEGDCAVFCIYHARNIAQSRGCRQVTAQETRLFRIKLGKILKRV